MIIAHYINGNCHVTLHSDGTKVREWEGEARPEFPESIDFKITNMCHTACAWCHEKSVPTGGHVRATDVVDVLAGLPKGVEIAIGGGNPLLHPDLRKILEDLNKLGLIANMTVHARDLINGIDLVQELRLDGLIHGLGMSWDNMASMFVQECVDTNTVFHFIAGVHNPGDVRLLSSEFGKVLILGYKWYGRGANGKHAERERVLANIAEWRYWLPTLMSKPNRVISFDNLALEQLNVREIIGEDVWSKSYMGDDGKFSMYVDAVKMEYAKSSTSERHMLNSITAADAFRRLQESDDRI